MIKVLSLGYGVQSFTLAVMSGLGDYEKPDFVIHADTLSEREETYIFKKKWEPYLISLGLNVITVYPKNKNGSPPFYTVSLKNGRRGVLRRQCTDKWKIDPIRRFISDEMNKSRIKKTKKSVDMFIGISIDEWQRMRQSDVEYINNVYPLVDMNMSRLDCENYLLKHNLEIPPKSACYFCPFHSRQSWRDLSNGDFKKAVDLDNSIRNSRESHGYLLYLSGELKPLSEIDFRTEQEHGQLSFIDECSGTCFI